MLASTNTHVFSLLAHSRAESANSLQGSLARLGSGFRAAPYGADTSFAVARALGSQVAPLRPLGGQTASEAVTASQLVEGGLSETTGVLQRMRELAMQSLNDATTATDRDSLNAEFATLKGEALRIAGSATAKGEAWLTAGGAARSLSIGSATLDRREVALVGSDDPEDGILTRTRDGMSLASADFDISGASSTEQRNKVVKALDGMMSDINTARFAVGTLQNEAFASAPRPVNTDPRLYSPTSPRVPDHDFEAEMESLRDLMLQSGRAVLSQARSLAELTSQMRRG